MLKIGITGGSGAGKTSALRALEKLGALILDCDAVYHRLLSENDELKSELSKNFPGVLQNDKIDRRALGAVVFSDEKALQALNEITHKYVIAETNRLTEKWRKQGGKVAAYDAIALIESGMADNCDIIVGVTAPLETRIERIIRRDDISRELCEKRISAQKPDSYFIENCGYILENVYNTSEEFEKACSELFVRIIDSFEAVVHL